MLALGVGQSVGQVGHGGVERQPAHGILRVLGLLLLVLGRPLACAPFLLGLQIALVHHFHLREPGRHDGVDAALARGEVAGDVADEVELRPLAVDVDAHARGEHADGRRDGEDGGHGEMRAHGVDALPHAQRHLGQLVIIEEVVLLHGLVDGVHLPALDDHVLAHGLDHLLQAPWHLRLSLAQRRVDAGELLGLGKSVVAGDDAVEHGAVEAADVAQVDGQLEGQRVAIGLRGRFALVVEGPPLLDDAVVGDAIVVQGARPFARLPGLLAFLLLPVLAFLRRAACWLGRCLWARERCLLAREGCLQVR